MKIGECCNREVIVADKEIEILEVARLMRRHHIGDVIIVERHNGVNRPVGILTDRDLVLEVLAQEVPPGEVSAADVMSLDLATVGEGEGVWETLERMRDLGVRRMPVVDDNGALSGLVTLDDLLELFIESMSNMAQLIKSELRKEARMRQG